MSSIKYVLISVLFTKISTNAILCTKTMFVNAAAVIP